MINRNRIIICGKKTTTLPTPAMMPSAIRLENAVSPSRSKMAAPRADDDASIVSMMGVAHANTAWNTMAMTRNRPIVPGTGRLKNPVIVVRHVT